MDGTCDTVTVNGHDGGPLRINREDYEANKKKYTLYKGKEGEEGDNVQLAPGVTVPPPSQLPEGFTSITAGATDADHTNERNAKAQEMAAAEDAKQREEAASRLEQAPVVSGVMKFGSKWRGVDANGNPVGDDSYKTEADAREALNLPG